VVIEELDAGGVQAKIADSRGLVLIDFWSPFCVPCRGLRRHMERLAARYVEDCAFGAVDVEKHPVAGTTYDITSVPTIMLFRDGNLLTRFDGAVLPSDLAAALDKALAA
jgi:thioredoxin-like negative regulator of GroEL